ncbi:MarR family transcriptional regulator [Amycolatopsis saalfeldensis]|nr:MarR family transcriptional regulator [Amycolatopsis saalfeldensis]
MAEPRAPFEQALAAAGLTLERPAMTVLATLQLAGQPLRVGEIAARMQVVGLHVTRHVNGLEKRGLLTRLADDFSGHLPTLGDESR